MISYEVQRQQGLTCLEFILIVVLIGLMVIGALTYMQAQSRGSHIAYRGDELKATAALYVENKVVTDAYIACWKDESRSTSPDCALESVAIARSQGRTEDTVAELLGSMGIFEKGCVESDNNNVKAIHQTPELSKLMTVWCAAHAPKIETTADAAVH
ncbi:hypothetical protein V0M98_37335 (plasmid) [Pseudomonas silesiensis]|uniref:hypothetical protein n=1 Tax=Pseudomonas silesiensis TaxID=1853130 RepID=UPI0030CEDED2